MFQLSSGTLFGVSAQLSLNHWRGAKLAKVPDLDPRPQRCRERTSSFVSAWWTCQEIIHCEQPVGATKRRAIPNDNMFGLEPIRWTYIFLPHKFPWSALRSTVSPPPPPPLNTAADSNSLDSAFRLYKFHPFHLRVAFIIRNVSLYVR